MKSVLALAGLILLLLGGSFLVRPIMQPSMDGSTRQALVNRGILSNRPVLRDQRSMITTAGGRSMHVRIADPGEGAHGHVILIHGLSTPSYVWRDYFKPLSEAGYFVAAPDLYGRGYSDRVEEPYTENLFLTQIDGLIQALEADRPVHLVGYSMGAAVALRYAASKPERVETVTLIAPAAFQCGSIVDSWFIAPIVGDWLMTVFGPELFASASEREWAQTKEPAHWRHQYWAQAAYRGYGPAVLSTLRNFNFTDSCAAAKAWAKTGRPTKAIFAQDDALIPVQGAKTAQELMPEAQIVTIPGLGHAMAYSHPELVLPEVMALLLLPQPPQASAPQTP